MTKDPIKWCIAGRCIGTATGWDESDTYAMMIYNLVGGPGYTGPTGDVVASFEKGYITSYTDDGDIKEQVDMLEAIKDCPVDHIDDTD